MLQIKTKNTMTMSINADDYEFELCPMLQIKTKNTMTMSITR